MSFLLFEQTKSILFREPLDRKKMKWYDKLLVNDHIDKEEKLNEFKKDLIFLSFDQAKEKGKFKTDHKSVTKGRNALWSHYQICTLCPFSDRNVLQLNKKGCKPIKNNIKRVSHYRPSYCPSRPSPFFFGNPWTEKE